MSGTKKKFRYGERIKIFYFFGDKDLLRGSGICDGAVFEQQNVLGKVPGEGQIVGDDQYTFIMNMPGEKFKDHRRLRRILSGRWFII